MENIQNRAMGTIASKIQRKNTFKVRSGILPIDDSINIKTVFSPKKDSINLKGQSTNLSRIFGNYSFKKASSLNFITNYKKYKYTITNGFNYNNELVYVIQFEPDSGAADYSGEMYISAETFAVLKVKYKIADGKSGEKVNLKLLLGIKYEELGREVLVIWNKNPDNIYSPKYIKTNTQEYTYFDRSLTFIENTKEKNRIKLRLDILSEAIVTREEEILIVETKSSSESEFSQFKQKEKTLIETITKYDPDIWAEYNIITPNQAIKDFEN